MVNIEDFIKRLENILDYYGLNASSFADKIGVQRSSMSHLLSGRNKPSLDFVLKILEVFPEVDLYWILNGKGSFPKKEENQLPHNITPKEEKLNENHFLFTNENQIGTDLFSAVNQTTIESKKTTHLQDLENANFNTTEEKVEKIVFFYKNGTFKVYTPD